MSNQKYKRIAADMANILNDLFNESNDEFLHNLTITHVELTFDLQDAKIYLSSMYDLDESEAINQLKQKEKFLKKKIAQSLKIRKIPNLLFRFDHSLKNYNHIDNLLKG